MSDHAPKNTTAQHHLLVPINIEALVCRKIEDDDETTWMDLTPDFKGVRRNRFLGRQIESEPRGRFRKLYKEPGVYLHWALPDGLTHGIAGENGDPPEFPLIPNRWLVVRLEDHNDGRTIDLKSRAWIVESDTVTDERGAVPWPRMTVGDDGAVKDYYVGVGKRFDADQWPGETDSDRVEITACGYGDPAFAAYYPACRGILGFHDRDLEKDLADSQNGVTLSYFVVGWYSDPSLDPLNRALKEKTIAHLNSFLEEKKWTYPGFEKAAETVKDAEDLEGRINEAKGMASRLEKRRNEFAGLSPEHSHIAQIKNTLDIGKSALEKEIAEQETTHRNLLKWIKDYEHELPGHILCHGIISEIKWKGALAQYPGGVPRGKPFRLAVGNTAVEALGALFNELLGSDLVQLLQAFQYDLLSELDRPGGWEAIAHKVFERTFRPLAHGSRWELTQKEPDELDEEGLPPKSDSPVEKTPPIPGEIRRLLEILNQRQREINRLKRQRDSTKSELYAAWYKQVLNVNAEEPAIRESGLKRQIDSLTEQIKGLNRSISESENVIKGQLQGPEWEQLLAELANFCPDWKAQKLDEPRFWQPNDPVVLMEGEAFKRSSRHGEDGAYRSDGKLLCRVSGQGISALKLTIPEPVKDQPVEFEPGDLDQWCRPFAKLDPSSLPPPVPDLFREALFLTIDPKRALAIAVAAYEKNADGLSEEYRDEVNVFRDLLQEYLKQVRKDARESRAVRPDLKLVLKDRQSGIEGVFEFVGEFPSPVVENRWQKNPWLPLFLQWQVSWSPGHVDVQRESGSWELTGPGTDRAENEDGRDIPESEEFIYNGTTILAPSAAWSFGERLREHNLNLESRSPELDGLQTAVSSMNILCQSLGGLTEQFLMRKARLELKPMDPGNGSHGPRLSAIADLVDDIDWLSPLTDENKQLFPLRSGQLKLEKLMIIDAFGQFLELDDKDGNFSRPLLPESLEGFNGYIRLELRLAQPARLSIQWPAADLNMEAPAKDPTQAVAEVHNPVCGWIIPNFFDCGLMIYDARGHALGALQAVQKKSWDDDENEDDNGIESFHWIDMPGSDTFFFGRRPDIELDPLGKYANWHLRGFVNGLLSLTGESGPAFRELLRNMDRSITAAGGSGQGQNPNLALLIGKPLALVRACLHLELDGLAACDQNWDSLHKRQTGGIESVNFQIRLGDRRRWHDTWIGEDGLVGFFQDQDYSRFYPASGLEMEGRDDAYNRFGYAPTLSIDQPLDLTLLLDPSRGVCADAGILPRRLFMLPYGDITETLENKEVVFFTGPLISTDAEIRMPQPSDAYGQWSWSHHPAVEVWCEEPITDYQKQQGQFFDQSLQISEGWLKLITAPLSIQAFKVKDRESVNAAELLESSKTDDIEEFEVYRNQPFMLAWSVSGADEIELKTEESILFKSCYHPLPTQYRFRKTGDRKILFTLTIFSRPPKASGTGTSVRKEAEKTIAVVPV